MLSVFRLSSCALLLLIAFLAFPVKGQDGEAEVGAVTIELMIGPGLSVAGGGVAAWDLYSFPDFSSTGTGIFKSRFIDTISRPAIWRWNGETISKIVDLDSLPLDGVEDGTVTISDVCLSSRGRIAMIGAVDGLAQVIWAQDDQGRFANVITRDPLDTGVYLNENLILNGETDLGKVSRLLALAGNYNDASGGEDGLMPPWWTPEEKLMFSVEVVGELTTTPFLCQAIIGKGIEIPQGKPYIWDEGLSTFSWHTIVNGQTNWWMPMECDGISRPLDPVQRLLFQKDSLWSSISRWTRLRRSIRRVRWRCLPV